MDHAPEQPTRPTGTTPSSEGTAVAPVSGELPAGHRPTIDSIVDRIASQTGQTQLVETLSGLSPRDLTSVLFKVYEAQAGRRGPLDILTQYTDNVLTNPADADPRKIHKLEGAFYDALPASFEAVELSIINPLGSNAVLASIDQKTVFSTTRNMEVLADISVALSIEAAKRRRVFLRTPNSVDTPVHLASCQRVARLRQRPTEPGYNAHWKMVGLASAGRNTKSDKVDFELTAMADHLRVYLKMFGRAESLRALTVAIGDVSIMEGVLHSRGMDRKTALHQINNGTLINFETLGIELPGRTADMDSGFEGRMSALGVGKGYARLLTAVPTMRALQAEFPEVKFEFNLERTAGMGYYRNLCAHIEAQNLSGETLTMADCGNPDWTQKMLSDKRETVFVSGMGSELFVRKFGYNDPQ